MQDIAGKQPAEDRDGDRSHQDQSDRGAEGPPPALHIAPPEALADEDGRGHTETEHCTEHQEHDDIGVGGRGERAFTQEAANPDRVDRPVERLEDVRPQCRQREGEQGAADRPGGEVALRFGQGGSYRLLRSGGGRFGLRGAAARRADVAEVAAMRPRRHSERRDHDERYGRGCWGHAMTLADLPPVGQAGPSPAR